MTVSNPTNVAASVRQRLRNLARVITDVRLRTVWSGVTPWSETVGG
jgi:hypothetical protein